MHQQIRRNGDHIVACYPDKYDDLLSEKVSKLRALLNLSPSVEVDIFESQKTNFRMRANFNIWRDNPRNDDPNGFYYAMYDSSDDSKGKKYPHEIKSFPRGTLLLNTLMGSLFIELQNVLVLRKGLFEARFVTSQIGQAVILLCYHTPITEDVWLPAAKDLSVKLGGVAIIGRSRSVKLATGDEFITEELSVFDLDDSFSIDSSTDYQNVTTTYKYFQTEGAFSQPNAGVCEKMLSWAVKMTKDSHSHDLLELYCGGGTFTVPLSANFRQVLATEVSKPSVALAQRCFEANDSKNIKVARLSSEEFTESYLGKKSFQRLADAGIYFRDFDFKTVFVDPPRSGLDANTCDLLCRFDRIVYISCNPETLARDIEILRTKGGHRLMRVAAFDQFPYTHHLEAGAVLVKESVSSSTGEVVGIKAQSDFVSNDVEPGAKIAEIPENGTLKRKLQMVDVV